MLPKLEIITILQYGKQFYCKTLMKLPEDYVETFFFNYRNFTYVKSQELVRCFWSNFLRDL